MTPFHGASVTDFLSTLLTTGRVFSGELTKPLQECEINIITRKMTFFKKFITQSNCDVMKLFVLELCILLSDDDNALLIRCFVVLVISTYREPVRGWIDNVYGPIGVIVGIGTGILHVYEGNLDSNSADMVPVDLVVNGLICSAKDTAEKFQNSPKM